MVILAGAGSYLLRRSSFKQNSFALMLNSGRRIEKFLIRRTEMDTYELGGRFFQTIPDIIDRLDNTLNFDLHFGAINNLFAICIHRRK